MQSTYNICANTLFEEGVRESTEKIAKDESLYCYLDRNGLPEVQKIRSILNSWFSLLPNKKKHDFLRRFQSKKNFDGVFFELFLLSLFINTGFEVDIDPALLNSKKLPDFLLTKTNNQAIVEATTNVCSFYSMIPNFKLRQQLIHELDEFDLHKIKLLIYDLKIIKNQKPSIKSLKAKLINHCRKLELADYEDRTFLTDEEYIFTYKDENLIFKCAFFVYKEMQGRSRKTVYGDSYAVGLDPTINQLNKSVKSKKSRYGKLETPFVICVNFPNMPLDGDVILSVMDSISRYKGGYFGKEPDLSNFGRTIDSSISALFISFVTPFNLHNPLYWLIKNPNANHPLEKNCLPIDYYEYEEESWVIKSTGISLPEVMGSI